MGCFARVYKPRPTTDVSIQKNPDKGDLQYIKLIIGPLNGWSEKRI